MRKCAPGALAASLGLCLASALGWAQTTPLEALRGGPAPRVVRHGEALAFARTFAVAADGPAALVAYVENVNTGRAQVRSALVTFGRDGDAVRAERVRDDVTLALDARAVALAWSATAGGLLVAAVTPPPRPRPAPGVAAPRRPAPTGLPPATLDPLGPVNSTGGDVVVVPLDAQGQSRGAPRVIFHENARLSRVSVVAEGDGFALAWTGATVTDDEVRGTVRAIRLTAALEARTPMALSTGLSGDTVGAIELLRAGDQTVLAATLTRCLAGAPRAPLDAPSDPSARIEAPNRQLMPQTPPREQEGPPIDCAHPRLETLRFQPEAGFAPQMPPRALRALHLGRLGGRLVVALDQRDGVALAAVDAGARTVTRFDQRPVTEPAEDREIALDFSLRERPSADAVSPPNEAPVAPPGPLEPSQALVAPAGIVALPNGAVVVGEGHRRVFQFGPAPRVLYDAPMPVFEAAALDVPGLAQPLLLAREGLWSGALRLVSLGADSFRFERLTAVRAPAAPPPNPRLATRTPYVFDESFARLWVHARTLRGVFMAFENTAGALAARPEALTDPRMPGIVTSRNRLRSRWESACGSLTNRAAVLARAGAGQALLDGVRGLCELHGDLQLGVPINPAL